MELRDAIIKTVCYFDIFDYPLTRAEVWRWLYIEDQNFKLQIPKRSITEIDAALPGLIGNGLLEEKDGLVFLKGRAGLPALRASRYRHSCRKWKRARRWARVFAALPGVRLVGVSNNLSYHNAQDDSDIDLYVIAAAGAVWRTRFLCAALAALFGLRPRSGMSRDKLCLSFFASDSELDLAKALGRRLSAEDRFSAGVRDVHYRYWLDQMVPLAGDGTIAKEFVRANPGTGERGVVSPPGRWRHVFWPVKFLPGDLLKDRQMKKFPPALIAAEARRDGSVVISDGLLKFHVNDRRREIYEKWENRVKSILDECPEDHQPN